jgi:hypothetical protein
MAEPAPATDASRLAVAKAVLTQLEMKREKPDVAALTRYVASAKPHVVAQAGDSAETLATKQELKTVLGQIKQHVREKKKARLQRLRVERQKRADASLREQDELRRAYLDPASDERKKRRALRDFCERVMTPFGSKPRPHFGLHWITPPKGSDFKGKVLTHNGWVATYRAGVWRPKSFVFVWCRDVNGLRRVGHTPADEQTSV